jgi:hypothetical protein
VVAADLVGRTADAGSPPTTDELSAVIDRFVQAGHYLDAYVLWHAYAPSDPSAQANVRDGAFNGLDAARPFVWTLAQGVETAAGPTLEHAVNQGLHVRYDGVSNPGPLASQLLVLRPGSYRLTGRVFTAVPLPATNLSWIVACAADGRRLASTSDNPLSQGWSEFAVAVEVPQDGCEGQWLRLMPVAADRPTDTEVWFDNLAVRRNP